MQIRAEHICWINNNASSNPMNTMERRARQHAPFNVGRLNTLVEIASPANSDHGDERGVSGVNVLTPDRQRRRRCWIITRSGVSQPWEYVIVIRERPANPVRNLPDLNQRT